MPAFSRAQFMASRHAWVAEERQAVERRFDALPIARDSAAEAFGAMLYGPSKADVG